MDRKHGTNAREPSLLAGIVWDAHGRRLSPRHSAKTVKRYRYYISESPDPSDQTPKWRIPAGCLEDAVLGKIKQFLTSPSAHGEFLQQFPSAVAIQDVQSNMAHAAAQLATPINAERRALLLDLIKQVVVHDEYLEIRLDLTCLLPVDQFIGDKNTQLSMDANRPLRQFHNEFTLTVPANLVRAGRQVKLVIPPNHGNVVRKDPALIKLIVKAHRARKELEQNHDASLADIAAGLNLSVDYFKRLLRVSTLAPDIVTAILDGRQPATLTRQRLIKTPHLPLAWDAQRALFGLHNERTAPNR